jgi:hypothetical protein
MERLRMPDILPCLLFFSTHEMYSQHIGVLTRFLVVLFMKVTIDS